jgi:hypothetical protein
MQGLLRKFFAQHKNSSDLPPVFLLYMRGHIGTAGDKRCLFNIFAQRKEKLLEQKPSHTNAPDPNHHGEENRHNDLSNQSLPQHHEQRNDERQNQKAHQK